MATGGVFQLLANDGKADRLLTATDLLDQRIQEIMAMREAQGLADVEPTLADLQRTHVLIMAAQFRPFVAVAFEYNKVRPSSGQAALGSTVQFSIPQFGDFFTDMVLHVQLSAMYHTAAFTAPAQGTGSSSNILTGDKYSFSSFPYIGYDWDTTTVLSGSTYQLVDPFGNTVTAGSGAYSNMVRYCEYPAEALVANTRFTVNGNPLDEYTRDTVVLMRQIQLTTDKTYGYNTLVGQENLLRGYSGPKQSRVLDTDTTTVNANPWNTGSGSNYAVAPLDTPTALMQGLFPQNSWDEAQATSAAPAATYAPNYWAVAREVLTGATGPQTPKYWHGPLDLWSKLKFWFNEDPRLAIASVSIPFGQRFIEITLAPQSDIAFEAPGLYVGQTYTDGSAITRTSFRPFWPRGTIAPISVSEVELYVNNLFVNPNVHDIYIKRVGFALIRVYRQQRTTLTAGSSGEQLMSQFKWPIEYILLGFQPVYNTAVANPRRDRDWHRMSHIVDIIMNDSDYAAVPANRLLDPSATGSLTCTLAQSALVAGAISGAPAGGVVSGGAVGAASTAPAVAVASTFASPTTVADGAFVIAQTALAQTALTVGTLASAAPTGGVVTINGTAAPGTVTIISYANLVDALNGTATAPYSVAGDPFVDCMYEFQVPTVTTLNVTAHGVRLYDTFQRQFYNAYIPYAYGGASVVTPKDESVVMINFSIFPNSYQPSGHVNVSRAREFYINWTSAYMSTATQGVLVSVARAINFLLITDGSAVLRYTT